MKRVSVLLVAAAGCIGAPQADSESPCGGEAACPVATLEAAVECGEGTPGLAARSDSPGTVAVVHQAASEGCCPTFEVEAAAWMDDGELRVSYTLSDDVCDCICLLDLRYVLGAVPPGPWTIVTPDGSTALVEVL